MKLIKLFLLPAVVCTLCASSACTPPRAERVFTMRINNNSTQLIETLPSYNYPDTTVPDTQDELRGVSAKGSTTIDSKEDWGNVLAETPGGKISFFFFSPDTINKYGWEQARTTNNIIARKDFSITDLQAANYIVNYPQMAFTWLLQLP